MQQNLFSKRDTCVTFASENGGRLNENEVTQGSTQTDIHEVQSIQPHHLVMPATGVWQLEPEVVI